MDVVKALAGAAVLLPLFAGAVFACPGDCDDDCAVSAGELVAAVSVAIGTRPVQSCPAADADANGTVTIVELVAAVDVSLHGCAASAESLAGGSFPVGVRTLTLTAERRAAPSAGLSTGTAARVLVTDVYYPARDGGAASVVIPGAEIDSTHGPYPLIVFAHGLFQSRRDFGATLAHLASRGFVAVAPDFPFTTAVSLADGNADPGDLLNQAGDLSFEIDTFTNLAEGGAPVADVVDADAVGLIGHSFGAATAVLAGFGGPFADARIDAIVSVAAGSSCFFGAEMFTGRALPVLVLHGTDDIYVDPVWSRELFDFLAPPKILAEITGADHLGYYSSGAAERDRDTIDAFTEALTAHIQSLVDLSLEVLERVPGSDPARCVEHPLLPDPESQPDPLLARERQVEILDVAVTAFFESTLRGDRRAGCFLRSDLSAFAPEVQLDVER